MRFNNNTGADVTISGLNHLFTHTTGNPTLLTAIVKRSGSNDNVKGTGNSVNDFVVANGESCVFEITWDGGLFNLGGSNVNSYSNIVRSAGYHLFGDYDIPNYFMHNLFYQCVYYNQQEGDIFDTSDLHPTTIGDNFLYFTWSNCTSLVNAVVPDTSNWNITGSIGNYFLVSTWYSCTSLVNAVVPDTSNWNITSIGNYFLSNTWYSCTSLVNAVVPDTSNWNVTSIGNYFLSYTFTNAFKTTTPGTVILKGSLYTGTLHSLYTNSAGINNSKISSIKVDQALIPTYQSSADWSNINDNKFISW
jgi:hypothetical protein